MTAAELRRKVEELPRMRRGDLASGDVLAILPSEGVWVTEAALAEALHGIHPGPRPFPGQAGGMSAEETAAAIIAHLS